MTCDHGDYIVLRFVLLSAAAVIALYSGIFLRRDHARFLCVAFGLFVIARIIRQYL